MVELAVEDDSISVRAFPEGGRVGVVSHSRDRRGTAGSQLPKA